MKREGIVAVALVLGSAVAYGGDAPAALGSSSSRSVVRMLAPDVLSTDANEFGGTISPDGREIYFTRSVPRSYRYTILRSERRGDGWSAPQVAPFSGLGRSFDPVFAPDGLTLLFISDRVIPSTPAREKRDYDVWQVTRPSLRAAWSPPEHLPSPVNTEHTPDEMLSWSKNEFFASLAADGTLYVSTDGYQPADGRTQIYRLPRTPDGYGPPENLGQSINGDGWENGEPMIAPDQSFLVFAGHERADGFGGWDVYLSVRSADGSWGIPINLGPQVNTPARDYSPRLEPDGHHLIFTSERSFVTHLVKRLDWKALLAGLGSPEDGLGNLYEVDLCALNVLPGATCAR